eukprot:355236-Chlamydomonas_euryale.AAC.11
MNHVQVHEEFTQTAWMNGWMDGWMGEKGGGRRCGGCVGGSDGRVVVVQWRLRARGLRARGYGVDAHGDAVHDKKWRGD